MNNKLFIIIGHYGSGKSEFSVNFAKKLKSQNNDVCLLDLDIVNPYFRSREVRTELINLGIMVYSDALNSKQGLDMPYLSGALKGQIVQNMSNLILDCGGDDVGIRVLKQFYGDIIKREYEVLMMVNVFRPETGSVDKILQMKGKLEQESGLLISGIVNNSNFLRHTTVDDMIYADKILKEVSSNTQIPIIYVSGIKELINQIPEYISGERFILNLSLRNSWL